MLRYPLALFLFAAGCSEQAHNEQVLPSTEDRAHAEQMAEINAMLEEVRLLKERQRLAGEHKTLAPPVSQTAEPDKKGAHKKQGPKKSVELPKAAPSKGGIVIQTDADDPLDGL